MLVPTTIGLNQVIDRGIHQLYRVTVVTLAIAHRAEVLLGSSTFDPRGKTWNFPQGGVRVGETLQEAGPRELNEEYRLSEDRIDFKNIAVLGLIMNVMPLERKMRKNDFRDKLLIYLAIPVSSLEDIQLNKNENLKHTTVQGAHQLWHMIGQRIEQERRVKLLAAFDAVNIAHELGLLTWNCQELPEQIAA